MAEIILVRHGQANSAATDEASYDRLSDLGRQQATWLGAHLKASNPRFDRVITGTLNRQIGTAEAMGFDVTGQDARLNEMSYFDLAHAMEAEHGVPVPEHTSEFAAHLPQLMDYWVADRLSHAQESYTDFSVRVSALIDEICEAKGRVLLVTSGGVIGMAVTYALGLGHGSQSKIMLQIMNSSLHRLEHVHGALMVGSFNATPHLDTPDRAHARTYV
ncbi:MAG: histidine phosphatase family protein [Pseudomonadota bacterium]